ncbi:MAG: DUF721 domain-containing protein [Firmicutes bacterium]|nr:DUF721 domain-containing protein [Bacillota bacterium]
MDNIGEIVKKILHKRGLWEVVKQQEVLNKWAEIVGEKIAARTKAVKINKGILWIKVSDSVWTHHLAMLKPKILTRIGDMLEKKTVKDIYFFVGELDDEMVSPEKREDRRQPYLQDFSREEIEKILELIPDQQQEIKQKVKIILEKGSGGQ